MKVCTKCGIEQDDSEFVFGKSKKNSCKACGRLACKAYKANNRTKIAKYNKVYKEEHKEEVSVYNRKYLEENRETIQENFKNRRKNNPNFRLRLNLSKRIQDLLKSKKNRKCYNNFIGCSLDEIKKWLESNFYGEMTWENYGSVWHIDHVIPCVHFNLENEEEVKVCFNWANVQPLFAKHNLSKSDTLYWIELMNHQIKLTHYSKKNKLDSNTYNSFLSNFKHEKSVYERNRARMADVSGTVKRIL